LEIIISASLNDFFLIWLKQACISCIISFKAVFTI
jgi:hypothetical protein